MRTAEIAQRFLTFFETRDHHLVPSASLIASDPTLLLVNAGMVPFKPYFLGQETPPYPRATTVQKCVRTPDIDEVGKTTRHGTFFQMCGNFSFGDYFKERAIPLAWELSTTSVDDGGLGLDDTRIWASVYRDDDEAYAIWRDDVGLPEARIVRRGTADNFWSMGVPGPCGPDSELFYDRGPAWGPDGGPDASEERFIEFWNLVFMQYERGETDEDILGPLPKRNIDTGLGLERMAMLLQDVDNLYEIDQLRHILDQAAQLAEKRYGDHHDDDVRLRVVADHVRASLMLIGDGVTPSNEGRGYVLRRIIRRAVRSMRLLGFDQPSLPQLLPVARDLMAATYPNVAEDFERISSVAYREEAAFMRTIAAGVTIFDTAASTARQRGPQPLLSGEAAFQLHDTYGFPIDLTLEMASEQGLAVDEPGFRRLMSEQRERAKADAAARKKGLRGADSAPLRDLRAAGETPFTGYQETSTETTVRGLVRDGDLVEVAQPGETVEIVLDRTPFYAESGGQTADEGTITVGDGRVRVTDVQKPVKGLIVHYGVVESGEVTAGADALAEVDPEWRRSARQAHSGTHVVHAALRQVLGPQALQSGSLNRPGYLRLDFAWGAPVAPRTLRDIEDVSNQALRRDLPVAVHYMPLEQARELGAVALFGETYDEIVRVVEIGGPWSRELCGGTHVEHAAQIGTITLLNESSIGSGVRRLEAYVGIEAMRYLATERAIVSQLADALKAKPEELPDRVAALLERVRATEREVDRLRAASVLAGAADLAGRAETVGDVMVVAAETPAGISGNDLRTLALDVRGRLRPDAPSVVALGSPADSGGASFVVAANPAAQTAGLSAGGLVKVLAAELGARGGGKADLAQGAGGDAGRLTAALAAVRADIANRDR